jgi:dihydroneopterin aldolase
VDYVKVGLFDEPRRAECIRALNNVARRTKIVGVMFADRGADSGLVPAMAAAGFAGAMLDTATKAGGRLLERTGIAELRDFVAACRSAGLLAGLAGSLEPPDVPRLLLLEPDILGFRRALCGGDRSGALDAAAVGVVRGLIPLDPRSAAHGQPVRPKVDYRLLAARGYAHDPGKDAPTDRVFVQDFVLPVSIGAYAHEREKPQRVRFNVDVRVLRPGHRVEDMRDVFSYDIVTDGIRMLVAHEHFAFVETLAERVAAGVLAHPRVVSVTVRADKLDVGPGSVGVEITRERPADIARVHQLYPAAGESEPKAGG